MYRVREWITEVIFAGAFNYVFFAIVPFGIYDLVSFLAKGPHFYTKSTWPYHVALLAWNFVAVVVLDYFNKKFRFGEKLWQVVIVTTAIFHFPGLMIVSANGALPQSVWPIAALSLLFGLHLAMSALVHDVLIDQQDPSY